MINATLSFHAKDQFQRRYPHGNMKTELDNAVPFGAQCGDHSQMFLSPCGAVFVVEQGVIKTTLTKELAIANMQAFCGLGEAFSPVTSTSYTISYETQLRECAVEHAERDQHGQLMGRKKRYAELREKFDMEHGGGQWFMFYNRAYSQAFASLKRAKFLKATKGSL